MARNVFDKQIDGVLRHVLTEDAGPIYVSDPSREVVEAIVDVLGEIESPPDVRVLGHEDTFKAVFEDFLVASAAADLVAAEYLSLGVAAGPEENPTVTAQDHVTTIVDAGATVGGLRADDERLVDAARERAEDRWGDADAYSLRTPPMSEVREQLSADLEAGVEEDFSGMLESLETARGDGDDLDEVTVSLLAAAKNDALLYDISRWGEDAGVASKATFSRTKSTLEAAGLVDTEKVPIEVGRPRLRLTLADERLEDAEPDQVVAAAQTVLN